MKDPTDLPGVIETANYIANQSDRWLFVALLLIFIGAVAWLTRYFTSQIEKAQKEILSISTAFNTHLIQANREMLTVMGQCQETLEKTTEIIERVERSLAER